MATSEILCKKTGLIELFTLLSVVITHHASVFAQITPDNSLGAENSVIAPNVNLRGRLINLIEGGALRDTNLFHSFLEFNVGEGERVYFANPQGVANIITRVTGSNISAILGTLGVDGAANLFLLNPNGIVFGQNAQLDVASSFLATTGDSFIFANGFEYSAVNPEAPPLLTVNIPLGVQFGGNPGTIQVQGRGHNITNVVGLFPLIRNTRALGLQVNSGNTIAFLGGAIDFDGSIVKVPGGRIELGSVEKGTVNIEPNIDGWRLNYQQVDSFEDISLSQQALIDASGFSSPGSIQLQGKQIVLSQGSGIVLQNFGLFPNGDIDLQAADSLQVKGTVSGGLTRSLIVNETLGLGAGGNVNISTSELHITDGAAIATRTFSAAPGGNLQIQVAGQLMLDKFAPEDPSIVSTIASMTIADGTAGNVEITATDLSLVEGGTILTGTFSRGDAGDITLDVTNAIELVGVAPTFIPSSITSPTFGSGNAGNVTINASTLVLQDGGRVDASTIDMGNAGSVTINASESITATGTVPNSINPSLITSSANILDTSLQKLFLASPILSGDSGNVTLNTPQLNILDGASVTVRNDGYGNAGNLQINADNIFLNNSGTITASTQSGEGGNLNLQIQDSLLLRNGSQISAEAGGTGNGGNIILDAELVSVLENSSIKANAFTGNGGNIGVHTQGIFMSRDSTITASSRFGVDGVITITTPNVSPNDALLKLPTQLADSATQIAQSCNSSNWQANSFSLVGRGGLPLHPDVFAISNNTLVDLGTIEEQEINSAANIQQEPQQISSSLPVFKKPIIESQGWIINEQGKVELVAYPTEIAHKSSWYQPVDCSNKVTGREVMGNG